MKYALVLALSLLASATFANGRDIVDKVEADELTSALVTKFIEKTNLHCQRPDLTKYKEVPGQSFFEIRYECEVVDSNTPSHPQEWVIVLNGTIKADDVLLLSYNTKLK